MADHTGPVAGNGNASATPEHRINTGVVADVADVAVSARGERKVMGSKI